MSKSVNVDFVTRQIEVDTDGKEHFISAAMAAKDAEASMLNAQNAAKEVKDIYGNGNFTPLSDLLGSLGTKLKRWGSIFANKVFASNLPIVYNNVAEMKADAILWEGMSIKTLGYYAPNDGGGASYIIRIKVDSDVDDGGSLHQLSNGLVAELIVENGTVCPEQFGAKGDGQENVVDGIDVNSKAIQLAINSGNEVKFQSKRYKVTQSIYLQNGSKIYGTSKNNSIIQSNGCDTFVIDGDIRNIDLGYMKLFSTNSCISVSGKSADVTQFHIHDIVVASADTFFTNEKVNGVVNDVIPVLWDITFKRILIYGTHSTNAIVIKGIGHFNVRIEQLRNGSGNVYLGGGTFTLANCNFGFLNGTTFNTQSDTLLNCNGCNFEADELITTNGTIDLKCSRAFFQQCNFWMWQSDGTYFMKINETCSVIEFIHCDGGKKGNSTGNLLYSGVWLGTNVINAIRFTGTYQGLYSNIDVNALGDYYKSTVRFNPLQTISYAGDVGILSQLLNNSLFIYKDKKVYYKLNGKYFDMQGNEVTLS